MFSNKDVAKYNPFYELLNRNMDETEKTFVQNQSCYHEVDSLSILSNVLENCSINSVEEFNVSATPQEKNTSKYLSLKFLNIDGNASNFDTLVTTLAAIKNSSP